MEYIALDKREYQVNMDDGRQTTDDGQRVITIARPVLLLRCANNIRVFYLKISVFGDEIFCMFEYVCFRNERYHKIPW